MAAAATRAGETLMAAAATRAGETLMAAAAAGANDNAISRSLHLFASLVEAEARCYAAYASRPAGSDLVRAFRGAATPREPVGKFLERIYRAGRLEGTCFVLAGIYMVRFFRSPAAIEARIKVEPATAHRLVAVALFVGAKFGGHPHKKWTFVFEVCSGRAIRAGEMAALERRFLRAIDYRLYVRADEFNSFIKVMEAGPPTRAPAPAPAPVPAVGCRGGKRKAAGEEDECRRVRPCLPTPAVVPTN